MEKPPSRGKAPIPWKIADRIVLGLPERGNVARKPPEADGKPTGAWVWKVKFDQVWKLFCLMLCRCVCVCVYLDRVIVCILNVF